MDHSVAKTSRGMMLVLSGPSGVGKGTVVEKLKTVCPELLGREIAVSVSRTTRHPRPGEEEGIHYYFTDRAQFERGIAEGDFFEHAEYAGNLYGTPKGPVEQRIAEGKIVVLDIDTQGAFQVRQNGSDALLVFLLPPSMEELERRLRGRQTESEEVILRRLGLARRECELSSQFDAQVYNREVDECAREICDLIREHMNRKNEE